MDALVYMSGLQNIRTFSQSRRHPNLHVILTNNETDEGMVDTVHLFGLPRTEPVLISRSRPEKGDIDTNIALDRDLSVADIIRCIDLAYSITWATFIDYEGEDCILTAHQIIKDYREMMFVVWDVDTCQPIYRVIIDMGLRQKKSVGWLTECDTYSYVTLPGCRVVQWTVGSTPNGYYLKGGRPGPLGAFFDLVLSSSNTSSVEASHDGELLLVTTIEKEAGDYLPAITVLRRITQANEIYNVGDYTSCPGLSQIDGDYSPLLGNIGRFLPDRNQFFTFDVISNTASLYTHNPIYRQYEVWMISRQIFLPQVPTYPHDLNTSSYYTMAVSRDGSYVFVRTRNFDYTISVDGSKVTRRLYCGEVDLPRGSHAIQESGIRGLFASILRRQSGGQLTLQASSGFRFSDRHHQLLIRNQSGEEADFSRAVFYLICVKDILKKRAELEQKPLLPYLPIEAWLDIFRFLHAAMWERVG